MELKIEELDLNKKINSILDNDINELRNSQESRSGISFIFESQPEKSINSAKKSKYNLLRNTISELRKSNFSDSFSKLQLSLRPSPPKTQKSPNLKLEIKNIQHKIEEISFKLDESIQKSQILSNSPLSSHRNAKTHCQTKIQKQPTTKCRFKNIFNTSSKQPKLSESISKIKEKKEILLSQVFAERRKGYELQKNLEKLYRKTELNISELSKEYKKIKQETEFLRNLFEKSEKVRLKQKSEIEILQRKLNEIRLGN